MLKLSGIKMVMAVCLGLIPTLVAAGPAVEVSPDAFDFGKTFQHVKVTHTFWVKSVGNAVLKIDTVIPGCGCTEAPLLKSVLAPGDSTALEITFATKSFMGNINKKPRLVTNAPDGKTEFGIRAQVLISEDEYAPLHLTPYKIELPLDGNQARRHTVFLIENRGETDISLQMVDQPTEYFEVALPEHIKAGETAEAMVVVHQDAATAEFEKSFTFEIAGAESGRYTVPVTRLRSPADASGN